MVVSWSSVFPQPGLSAYLRNVRTTMPEIQQEHLKDGRLLVFIGQIITLKISWIRDQSCLHFFTCCEEIKDLSLIDALGVAFGQVRSSGELAEYVVITMIDVIMGAAIELIKSI